MSGVIQVSGEIPNNIGDWIIANDSRVVALINQAVQAEREACAKIAEQMMRDGLIIGMDVAKEIRARK